ncbi:MAG TPA: pilus assembly protein PilF, partial [Nitrospinae bacterium]|nr:pilus assembly protein PilF [Nitrospinota bacterium]
EKALGPEHPDVATGLNNLASVLQAQGLFKEAEPLYKRTLSIVEKSVGPDHPRIVRILRKLAGVYEKLGKKEEAAGFLERAEAMKKRLTEKR